MSWELVTTFFFGFIWGLVIMKVFTKKKPVHNLLSEFEEVIKK